MGYGGEEGRERMRYEGGCWDVSCFTTTPCNATRLGWDGMGWDGMVDNTARRQCRKASCAS